MLSLSPSYLHFYILKDAPFSSDKRGLSKIIFNEWATHSKNHRGDLIGCLKLMKTDKYSHFHVSFIRKTHLETTKRHILVVPNLAYYQPVVMAQLIERKISSKGVLGLNRFIYDPSDGKIMKSSAQPLRPQLLRLARTNANCTCIQWRSLWHVTYHGRFLRCPNGKCFAYQPQLQFFSLLY